MQPRTHRHRQLLQKKGITPSIPYIPQAIPPPPLAQAQAGGGGGGDQQNSDKITRGRSESMMLNRGLHAREETYQVRGGKWRKRRVYDPELRGTGMQHG